ncbi:protein MMS22-like [Lutzomyia longipalpis]|uniref:protein MMS22-like n=1 Tax=Lutzomyia longipalpis TaxID=7200 RepID=UPI0024845B64|nr:protein MMS22-like [Lutzomyia longipalpis]
MDFAWSDDEENDEALMEISAQLEENEVHSTQPDCSILPEDYHTSHFVCTGKDVPASSFHSVSFVQNNDLSFLTSGKKINLQEYSLFNICASEEVFLEENLLKTLFLMAKTTALELKCGKKLPRAVSESNFNKRMHITTLLHYTRSFFNVISREELQKNLKLLESIIEAEDSIPSTNILPTIHSNPSSTTHHFFHGCLEWRWLILTILTQDYRANAQETDFRECQSWEKLLNSLSLFIFDLLKISLNTFNGLKLSEILTESPFHCVCVKEVWFLIISLLETFKEKITFWEIFSSCLSSLISGSEKFSHLRPSPNKCENPHIFTLWILLHIVKLQEIPRGILKDTPPNVDLLDKTVKSFFAEDPSELEARVAIRLTASLILNNWPCAIDVIVQFWEYFHKKINTNFYIPSDGMSSLLVPNDSAMSYIKAAKQSLDIPLDSLPPTQTSYSTFCHSIAHFLHKFSQTDFMRNFQKVTGRIFIKFTTKKWQSMNETGIHNLTSLLVILTTMGDEKIIERVESICLLIPLPELAASRQLAASKSLVALLILAFRQSRPSQYPGKLVSKLNLTNTDTQTPQGVLKVFAHGMCDIFAESESFDHEEHILVAPWVRQYLKSCPENDKEFLLNHLNRTLVRIQGIIARGDEGRNLQELLRAFFLHILPYVKEEYETNEGTLWLPELTGNLCLAASGQNGLPRIEDLFSSFMEMNCKNPKSLFTLFSMVATSDKVSVLNPGLLIHHWIRCMIFCSSAANEDLRMATEAIAALPELQEVCAINREEFLASREPFYAFLFGIGQKYEQLENPRDKMALSNKFHNYVKSFGKWAMQGLSTPDGANNVYRTIAVIVLHCSHIIYVPMKINCFMRLLMAEFMLPASLLLGKTQSVHIVRAMMKIFPVFLEGIAKLDYKGDQYLTRAISNMILHWTPHFKTTTNASMAAKPFVKCLTSKEPEMGNFVIEKFCEGFFPQTPRKGATSNTSLAINVLKEIFVQSSSTLGVYESLLDIVCLPLMDHVLMSDDFAPSKKLILDLLEFIFKGEVYRGQAKFRLIVVRGLKDLTTNKLSFQTSAYFLFMLKMAKVNPMAVRDILPHLKEQIVEVEFRRGSGRDARLRQQLNSLEDAVAKEL